VTNLIFSGDSDQPQKIPQSVNSRGEQLTSAFVCLVITTRPDSVSDSLNIPVHSMPEKQPGCFFGIKRGDCFRINDNQNVTRKMSLHPLPTSLLDFGHPGTHDDEFVSQFEQGIQAFACTGDKGSVVDAIGVPELFDLF
jgi:hypothetical protein